MTEQVTDQVFDVVAFADEVRNAMVESCLSYRQVSTVSGVDPSNIHRLVTKYGSPSVETYLRLRAWLDKNKPSLQEAIAEWVEQSGVFMMLGRTAITAAKMLANHIRGMK